MWRKTLQTNRIPFSESALFLVFKIVGINEMKSIETIVITEIVGSLVRYQGIIPKIQTTRKNRSNFFTFLKSV